MAKITKNTAQRAKMKKAPKELAAPVGAKSKKQKADEKAKETLDKLNLDAAVSKTSKELKYKYPADITTNKQKKEFRRKKRTEVSALEAKIIRLGKSDKPEAKKELKEAESELRKIRLDYFNVSAQ